VTLSEQASVRAGAIDLGRLHELASEQDPRHLGTVWYAAPVAGQAADAASTLLVLSKVRGAHEANPVMAPIVARPAVFIAVKLAGGAGLALTAHMLAKQGHVKAAKIFSGAATILGVGCAVHNVGLLR
jgi:hypothetical protein